MKIYFFGGTFDPPHLGHQKIAEYCSSLVDKFIVIPAKQSPHKSKIPVATDQQRVEMLEKLVNIPNMIIDDYELNSPKPNYTIHTIHYLQNKWAEAEFTMIVGEDQYNSLHKWYKIDEIRKQVHILCFHRTGFKPLQLNDKNDEFIPEFRVDISSTKLRKSLRNNENLESMVNQDVLLYIKENNLYL